MKVINNGDIIKHVRGDSGIVAIKNITLDGEEIEIDSAIFSVKKKANSEEYALQISMNDDNEIVFTPEDTAELTEGKYVYDIQITVGEKVYTPVIGEFILIADITRNGVE